MPTIRALQADINAVDVVAIVSELGSDPGKVSIVPGVNCKAEYIIVTLGPAWQGGGCGESEDLSVCYRQCIEIAEKHDISSIAFPAVSAGANKYPLVEATGIAVSTVSDAVQGTSVIGEVVFCCTSRSQLEIYRAVLMQPG